MARKRVCIRNNRSDNDSEDELQESVILQMSVEGSSVRKTRGFTRMADVWNLPPHSLIVFTFNKVHQPVGVEGTVLKRFIGFMARLEELMSQCSDNSHGGSGGSIIWDKNR
ncbi:sporozoite surface protein 2-like [Senna tora]|uniref:Sporozoite surface protein 2-like n=1 Tax=Senna tora TaxID=362788 RepID=A0A834SRB5_9FABA|nr:sporozoite surface protein 2-like [Senna tora]